MCSEDSCEHEDITQICKQLKETVLDWPGNSFVAPYIVRMKEASKFCNSAKSALKGLADKNAIAASALLQHAALHVGAAGPSLVLHLA